MEATVIVLAIVVLWIYFSGAKGRALRAAQRAYQESLKVLKSDPTNPDLKQHTLACGRAYSHLTRNKKGVTFFDELALMNDINAAWS